jgi:hypothetical protein
MVKILGKYMSDPDSDVFKEEIKMILKRELKV